MNYVKDKTSAFAIAALVFYLLSVSFNAMEISKGLKFTISGSTEQSLNLPNAVWIVTGPLFLMASRLYFQAWAIDETFLIIRLKQESGLPALLKWVELFIRCFWLGLTMGLPNVLANTKFPIPFTNYTMTWEIYLVVIFLTVFIWDLLLVKYIMKLARTNNEDTKRLYRWWFVPDFLLLLFSIFNALVLNFNFLDWKWIAFFITLTYMIPVCGFQIVYFYKDIAKHKIKFEIIKSA